MKTRNLIFRTVQGVTAKQLLRKETFTKNLNIKRLYDISEEVNNFIQDNPTTTYSYNNDSDLFDNEILFDLPTEQNNLYRTYIAENLTEIQADELYKYLDGKNEVEYIQFDEENELNTTPNDPSYNQQWAMPKIEIETAWNKTLGNDIIVGVVDTGVDYQNSDLSLNMWKNSQGHFGYDFSNNTPNPMDTDGHGTHVAGIISAITNNSIQIAGVAPKAKIMAIKVFPNAYDSRCAAGIKYAVDNGAKVINNSYGPTSRRPSNPVLEDAISYAYSKGVIIVFAAGNGNDDVQYYSPANYAKVIAVGATDSNDNRASFSNYGTQVAIAAPGVNILSLKLNSNTPINKSGTSMAAPFVTGVIALIQKLNPNTSTFETVKMKLQTYGDVINTDKPIGKRLNAGKSVIKDPEQLLRIEEQVDWLYRGVTGCAERAQAEAMNATNEWINKKKKQYPTYSVKKSGHLGGTAQTTTGQEGFPSNARYCRTLIRIRCFIEFNKS
tara:strand:+ start:272 stop:1756 length:1485 start_codon:yes stop_codon:yes gene_type:complete